MFRARRKAEHDLRDYGMSVEVERLLKERQKLASKLAKAGARQTHSIEQVSKLCKGSGRTESAKHALEQVKLVSKLCKDTTYIAPRVVHFSAFIIISASKYTDFHGI